MNNYLCELRENFEDFRWGNGWQNDVIEIFMWTSVCDQGTSEPYVFFSGIAPRTWSNSSSRLEGDISDDYFSVWSINFQVPSPNFYICRWHVLIHINTTCAVIVDGLCKNPRREGTRRVSWVSLSLLWFIVLTYWYLQTKYGLHDWVCSHLRMKAIRNGTAHDTKAVTCFIGEFIYLRLDFILVFKTVVKFDRIIGGVRAFWGSKGILVVGGQVAITHYHAWSGKKNPLSPKQTLLIFSFF